LDPNLKGAAKVEERVNYTAAGSKSKYAAVECEGERGVGGVDGSGSGSLNSNSNSGSNSGVNNRKRGRSKHSGSSSEHQQTVTLASELKAISSSTIYVCVVLGYAAWSASVAG
jgi:hypothetical protein